MDIKITDIGDTKISGVKIALKKDYDSGTYREDYFTWSGMPIVTDFKTSDIMMGILEGWHHTPVFDKIEYHDDKESFYFISGTAIMYFVDIKDGRPVLESGQIVRIPTGTEIEIETGKGHFVAVAQDDHFAALVTSPVQDAPRLDLPEIVQGI